MKQNKKSKHLWSLMLILAMAMAMMIGMTLTANAAVPDKVYYRVYDYSNAKLTYTDNEIAGTDVTEVTSSTTEWANGTYVVLATTTISSRIEVTGTVNLIIFDGATLTAEEGITVSEGNTLNIYMGNSSNSIQSTGQLNATALEESNIFIDQWGAGIGGYRERDVYSGNTLINKSGCGNVNIHGGWINVQNNSSNVAGIGGSVSGAGGNITIYYSQVTAYGKKYVSAIGAGYNGSSGTVAIYGGVVNAIVTRDGSTPQTNGINASLTVGKDVAVYALEGEKTPDEDLSGQTNVAPEGGGQVTTFNHSMFTRYTGPAPSTAHEHSFTYNASGDTITATCSNSDGCTLKDKNYQATLTIEAPDDLTYDGTAKAAKITDLDGIRSGAEVQYREKTGDSTYADPTNTAPTDPGTYKASITLGTGDNKATASVEYSIIEEYSLWVGGTQVTSANKDNVLNDQGKTVSFTPATESTPATLTLDGANITTGYGDYDIFAQGGIYYSGTLTIEVSSDSTVDVSGIDDDVESYGIFCLSQKAVLTITGEGTLTAKGKTGGINVALIEHDEGIIPSNVTITGCAVTASGGQYGIEADSVTITGGALTASGGNQGIYAKSVTIGDGMSVWSGKDESHATLVENTSSWTHEDKWVQVAKAYPLWVGGVQVTGANKDDVLKGTANEGKVIFSPEVDDDPQTDMDESKPATLTLDGAIIDGDTDGSTEYTYYDSENDLIHSKIYGAILTTLSNLTINVKSNSTVTGPSEGQKPYSYGIYSRNDLTITGDGTLNASGGNYGYNAGVDADNIIIDGKVYATGVEPTESTHSSNDSGIKATTSITIKEDAELIATGSNAKGKAIDGDLHAKLINHIAGTGWKNEAGTAGQKKIEVNTAGQDISSLSTLKKVKFPAEATPSGGGSGTVDPVQQVVDKIKALDPAASDYLTKAQAAVEAYNKLTNTQKEDKRFTEQEVATKFAAAQKAVKAAEDQKVADEVSALVEKLPADPSKATEDEAQAALAAYRALTDAQKELLSAKAKEIVDAYKYYYEKQYAEAQKAKLKSVKAKKHKKATVKWEAVPTASGYQLYYKAKGKKAKKVNVNDASTVTKTVKKLKAGKKYTFKVRTFTKVENLAEPGTSIKVYGKWSNKKKIKAKK